MTVRDREADAANAASGLRRFIPRDEVRSFTAWTPNALGGQARTLQSDDPAAKRARMADEIDAARDAGYRAGQRDGALALEAYKRQTAATTGARLDALFATFEQAFAQLESHMADTLAASAVALAREVVRDELVARPERVASVAAEAVSALLDSARHVRIHVHPDDLALVRDGITETLAAREARLIADHAVTRGGCVVQSTAGQVDASIERRWHAASAALGGATPLHPDETAGPAP